MGLFDLDTYKSDSWKAEDAMLRDERTRFANQLASLEQQRERISDFLMSNSRYSDSFEYKKMQLQLQQLDDEIARGNSAYGCLENDIYLHDKQW